MLEHIYELRKNCCGTGGRDGTGIEGSIRGPRGPKKCLVVVFTNIFHLCVNIFHQFPRNPNPNLDQAPDCPMVSWLSSWLKGRQHRAMVFWLSSWLKGRGSGLFCNRSGF